MDECPICLEPLTGTVVHLGCCKKQVHIQCYVSRCSLCRAELPMPQNFPPPQHVIVPVPVAYQAPPISKWKIFIGNLTLLSVATGAILILFYNH